MERRAFISSITLSFLAPPLAAEGQQAGKVYRIGFLGGGSPDAAAPWMEEFRQGLRELGYAEGRNIVIEYRWAEGKQDRLPELAADLKLYFDFGARLQQYFELSQKELPLLNFSRAGRDDIRSNLILQRIELGWAKLREAAKATRTARLPGAAGA